MGLLLPTYEAPTGMIVSNAYLALDYISWSNQSQRLDFHYSVFFNKNAFLNHKQPLVDTVAAGFIVTESVDLDTLRDELDAILLDRIHAVEGKTESECFAHNQDLDWMDPELWSKEWNYNLTAFANAILDHEG